MTESLEVEILVDEVNWLRQQVEDLRPKAKIGNLAEAKLAKKLESFNAKINELFGLDPDRFTFKQDQKRGHEHLLWVTIDDGPKFRFPYEFLTGDNKKKVEKIMKTYKYVPYSRFDYKGTDLVQLKNLLTRCRKQTGYSLTVKETVKDMSFSLMCIITGQHVKQLPENLIVAVGKAIGLNFRFGFWKFQEEQYMSNRAINAEAKRLLQANFTLVYDQDFWAELSFFTDGYLDRGQFLESVGEYVATVRYYTGNELLFTLPDGSTFVVVGQIPRQCQTGTVKGDRRSGWYIATETGWKKYSHVVSQSAEEQLFWLANDNDGDENISSRDFYGMNTRQQAVTVHTEGIPMPKPFGIMNFDGGYGAGIFVLVDENFDLLGIRRTIGDFNADGYFYTPATSLMKHAWEQSGIKKYVPYNLIIEKKEEQI